MFKKLLKWFGLALIGYFIGAFIDDRFLDNRDVEID